MKTLILPFLFLLTFVVSCKTDDSEILEKTNSYDVYVAGKENGIACYWKNNIKTVLTNGDNINTLQIKVENNNIYVTGILLNNSTSNGIQYFWKNNIRADVKQYLNIPNNAQYNIQTFTVNNGDIYFAGYVENPIATSITDKYELCFWKNGLKTILYKSQYISSVESIFVDGADVYVSTQKIDNNQNNDNGYFKNNIFYSIPTDLIYNFAKNSNGLHLLIYKNQTYYSLNLNTNTQTIIGNYILPIIFGKLVSDKSTNDLYTTYGTAGEYSKNAALITSGFSQLPEIQDLFVLDNNIYMIKYKFDFGYNAKVFINGVESQDISSTIPNGSLYYQGTFNSLFVVEN
jgi:hypothetical protein